MGKNGLSLPMENTENTENLGLMSSPSPREYGESRRTHSPKANVATSRIPPHTNMQYDEAPVQSTMQRRRNDFKSTATRTGDRYASSRAAKSKAYGRGRKKTARRAKRSLPQPLTPYDYVLNKSRPGQNYYQRVVTIRNASYFVGTGAAVGASTQFNLTGAVRNDGWQMNFNVGGAGISELTSLQQLFGFYRIKMVRATFRLQKSEFTDAVQVPEMMYRYNYDPNRVISAGGGSMQLDSSTNIKVHRFTNDSPYVTATIYPKVLAPTYSYSGVTDDGYALGPIDSPWIDLSAESSHGGGAAVPYFGLDYWINTIPADNQINIDVELTIEFKMQH